MDRSQVLRLALTASRSNRRCSEAVGIDEEEIAFPFDIECNEILTEWEMEQEEKRLEAFAAGALLSAYGGSGTRGKVDRDGPIMLDA